MKFKWKLEAWELMENGRYSVPARATIWRYRSWADEEGRRLEALSGGRLAVRVWQVPGGWILLNEHLEAYNKRRKDWHALIRRENT